MRKASRSISQVRIIYLATTIFLVALCSFTFIQLNNLIDSSAWVHHTNQVTLSLERSSTAISDAETNQRGYLLTGDSLLLQKSDAAYHKLFAELNLTDSLIQDNPIEIKNSRFLHAAVAEKVASMKEVFRLYASDRAASPEFIRSIIEGSQKMEEVKRRIELMSQTENNLLALRLGKYASLKFITPLFILLVFFGALLILFLSYMRINKALKLSERLQEGLAQEKTLAQTILDSSPDTIIVLDKETRIISINKLAAEEYAKLYPNDVIGKKIMEVSPDALTGEILSALGGERRVHNKFKSLVSENYYEINYIPLRNRNGVYAVMVVSHDITDRMQTEDKLLTLNQTHQYAEQVGMFGSYKYNFDTVELVYSDNLYRILGCEPQEFPALPENFMKFIHPDDLKYVMDATTEAFSEKQISRWEYRIIRKDGRVIYVRGTGKIIVDSEDTQQMIGTLQDITEEKELGLTLAKKNEELEKMNTELQSFAYVSSHDLQEPLRKIQTFASRIIEKEYDVLSDGAKDYFNRIQLAARRMQTLIEDLIAYSRANATEQEFKTAELNTIVNDIKEELTDDIKEKNATIEVTGACRAHIIPFQFRQLMHNLIGNSLKFRSPDRPPSVRVHIEVIQGLTLGNNLLPRQKYCHVSVSDNGIGFDPNYSEKIFEVFQRLHTRDKYNGTGIGLAIVKKIVQNHNGFIKATGELNKGTTIDIYIPLS